MATDDPVVKINWSFDSNSYSCANNFIQQISTSNISGRLVSWFKKLFNYLAFPSFDYERESVNYEGYSTNVLCTLD
jgi:hypothetical protein